MTAVVGLKTDRFRLFSNHRIANQWHALARIILFAAEIER